MEIDTIVAQTRRLLESMDITDVPLTTEAEDAGRIRLSIASEDVGHLLIGKEGTHLEALQHLLHCILRRHLKEPVNVVLDVNNYRRRREEALVQRAGEAAKLAQNLGRPVILEPMSAADRRIVHTSLAQKEHIHTESVGEGDRRRVVVRAKV